jgi:intein/homing endonuclease
MAIKSDVLQDQRLVKALDSLTKDFNADDIELLKQLIRKNNGEELQLLMDLMNYTYTHPPVSVRTFVEDDPYLGLKGQIYPALMDDLEELFTNDYDEAVLAGCIDQNALISTEYGQQPLKDMIHNKSKYKVHTPLTNDLSGSLPATDSGTQKVVELRLADGTSLKLTPDHRLHNGKGWVPVGKLKKGSLIAVASYLPVTPTGNVPLTEAEIIGYWVGDGSVDDYRARFVDQHKECAERLIKLFSAIGFSFTAPYLKGNAWEIHSLNFKTSGLFDFFDKYGLVGNNSKERLIPDSILKSNDKTVAAFLKGFFDCEACVVINGKLSIQLGLNNGKLLRQVNYCLLRFGIKTRIKKLSSFHKKQKKMYAWELLTITGKTNLLKFIKYIGLLHSKKEEMNYLKTLLDETKENTNVDIVPVSPTDLMEWKRDNNVVWSRDNKYWSLATIVNRKTKNGRDGYVSKAYLKHFCADHMQYDTSMFTHFLSEAVAYEEITAIDHLGIEIPVGDIGIPHKHHFVANGIIVHNSIGWGKSTLAETAVARMIYEVSCFRNPQKALGLMDGSVIAFINVSINKDSAKKVVFQGLKSKMENSKYFREYFPIVNSKAEELRLKNNVWVFPVASGESGILGFNVLGGIMDEVNFMDYIENSKRASTSGGEIYDQAERLQKALIRRMKSRYMKRGKLPGILLQVSSAAYPDDYTERRMLEAKDNPKIFCRRYSQWDTPPPDKYCGQMFQLSLGNLLYRPKIITCQADLEECQTKQLEIIDVPVEYRPDFERDVDSSIRDLAGRPTLTIHPFIMYREKVIQAMERGPKEIELQHPFNMESSTLQDGGMFVTENLLIPKWKKRFEAEEDPEKKANYQAIYNNLKQKPRYIHIDLAKTSMAGFSMGYVQDYKEVIKKNDNGEEYTQRMPIIVIEFMLRIVAPQYGEIEISNVRSLVHELRSYGYRIAKVTFDQYQCVAEDTMINTNNGILPIKDVTVGDYVHSRTGAKKILNKWCFGEQDTLVIETKDGSKFEGTHKHKIEVATQWRYKNGLKHPVWEWVKLSNVKVGDVVSMADKPVDVGTNAYIKLHGDKKVNGWRTGGGRSSLIDCWEYPEYMTEDLAELLGITWGDGHVAKDGLRITVESKDAQNLVDLCERVFGEVPTYRPYKDDNFGTVGINSRWLIRWMEENGIVKPYIPEAILRGSRSVKAAFLKGLFSADGSVDKNDGKVSFSTKHKKLCDQVKLILLTEFGLQSNIAVVKRGYDGDYLKTGYQYILSLRGSREVYLTQIGFTYSSKTNKLKLNSHRKGRTLYTKVKQITPGRSIVYDIEVEGDPSYVANGFVSHNSTDSQQQFAQQGIESELLSVDRTNDPYNAYKDALYEDRLITYWYEPAYWETIRLEKNEKTGKVDHVKGFSKDVSDAIAGVCYLCVENAPSTPSAPPIYGKLYEARKEGEADILKSGFHGKTNLAVSQFEKDDEFDWVLK